MEKFQAGDQVQIVEKSDLIPEDRLEFMRKGMNNQGGVFEVIYAYDVIHSGEKPVWGHPQKLALRRLKGKRAGQAIMDRNDPKHKKHFSGAWFQRAAK